MGRNLRRRALKVKPIAGVAHDLTDPLAGAAATSRHRIRGSGAADDFSARPPSNTPRPNNAPRRATEETMTQASNLFLLTVRGTLHDKAKGRTTHDQTAGAPQGIAAARALGDLSHVVLTPCSDAGPMAG